MSNPATILSYGSTSGRYWNVILDLTFILALGIIVNPRSTPQAEARAFLVFGDSLVDNGNNNYLATTARADSHPYGIDYYPTHQPTGRFSNGFNIPDFISLVHLVSTPTYKIILYIMILIKMLYIAVCDPYTFIIHISCIDYTWIFWLPITKKISI